MANIYLTGMTAPQASPSANQKSLSFSGVLHSVLVSAGHNVTWGDPSLLETPETLNKYDSVIVGVSPVTSLSANRAYGALSIIEMLWESDKLTLLIDAPNTQLVAASLKSIDANPVALMKEFYSYRKGYREVVSDIAVSSRISQAANKLANKEWPRTIYPSLPWAQADRLAISRLLPAAAQSFVGINLDSFLLTDQTVLTEKSHKWAVDSTSNKSTEKLLNTLTFPHAMMRWNKGCSDSDALDQISRSSGAVISSHRVDGTFWTYRYAQALNSKTPIYSDWKETSVLGESWSHLATTIETMDDHQRYQLSLDQKSDYQKNIPTKEQAISMLEKTLRISKS
jgi:hypothetical protein